MGIINNVNRVGNFTSSKISKLMTFAKDGKSFGKPALTYISECNMERRLGRSLNSDHNAKPTNWGTFIEKRVFQLLGEDYQDGFDKTVSHPTIGYWHGTPDGNKFDEGKTVFDIKSPFTLKSFCQLADCKTIEEIRANHDSGEDYFWQLVSNAILTNSNFGELIFCVPFKNELQDIRDSVDLFDGNMNSVAFINWASDDELPYIPDNNQHYKNINIIRFEIKQEDKDALTERVLEAGKLLINVQTLP